MFFEIIEKQKLVLYNEERLYFVLMIVSDHSILNSVPSNVISFGLRRVWNEDMRACPRMRTAMTTIEAQTSPGASRNWEI